jgi:hypothetical protein
MTAALRAEPDEIIDDVDDDVRKAIAELSGDAPPADKIVSDDPGTTSSAAGNGTDTRTAAEIARDASGRFAKRDATKADTPPTTDTTTPAGTHKDASAVPSAADAPPVGGPPASWSVKAKAAWDQLPADVKADIAKREGEVAQGLKALTDYKDLKPFADLATQHNTTIAKALDRYVRIDQLCNRDLPAGLAMIAQNSGLNQQQAAELFAGLAQKFGGTVPAKQPGTTTPNGAAAPTADNPLHELLQPLLQPLVQKIGTLEGSLTQRQQDEQRSAMQRQSQAIQEFANDPANRYFPELEEMMTRFLESGIVPRTGNAIADLRAAYDMAARAHPEVSQALIEQRLTAEAEAKRKREQEAADKARNASRSMSGSRVPGTVTRDTPQGGGDSDDVEADVRAAIRQLSMA